jgi:hypothetical protein
MLADDCLVYQSLPDVKRPMIRLAGSIPSVRCSASMFVSAQTLNVGMDILIIGLALLIALGLERYCQEGYERG